jgi:hypothetical protein
MTETISQGYGNKKGTCGEDGACGGPLNRPYVELQFALSR